MVGRRLLGCGRPGSSGRCAGLQGPRRGRLGGSWGARRDTRGGGGYDGIAFGIGLPAWRRCWWLGAAPPQPAAAPPQGGAGDHFGLQQLPLEGERGSFRPAAVGAEGGGVVLAELGALGPASGRGASDGRARRLSCLADGRCTPSRGSGGSLRPAAVGAEGGGVVLVELGALGPASGRGASDGRARRLSCLADGALHPIKGERGIILWVAWEVQLVGPGGFAFS